MIHKSTKKNRINIEKDQNKKFKKKEKVRLVFSPICSKSEKNIIFQPKTLSFFVKGKILSNIFLLKRCLGLKRMNTHIQPGFASITQIESPYFLSLCQIFMSNNQFVPYNIKQEKHQMAIKSINLFLFCLILGISAFEADPNYDYSDFCAWTQCTYTGDEYDAHKQIFEKNYAEYLERRAQGQDIQMTQFFDWNQTQYKSFFNYNPSQEPLEASVRPLKSGFVGTAPDEFDWRDYDKVTPVKHQLGCGSCWAFAAVATYESQMLLANGNLSPEDDIVDLAEQYPLECSRPDGCLGGSPRAALVWMKENGGAPSQADFPYEWNSSKFYGYGLCNASINKISISKPIIEVRHYRNFTEQFLKQDLYQFGPLVVTLHAKNSAFKTPLSNGEINNCPADSWSKIDHAVVLVGYNKTHWIIKNSWGENWGKAGYGYISKENDCGLSKWGAEVVVENDLWPQVSPDAGDDENTLTLTVEMTSFYKFGWFGNVLAFRQGNHELATFGEIFNSGAYRTHEIRFPTNGERIQLVVDTLGNYTFSLGFTIKYLNGTVLFQRSPGTSYQAETIFFSFCPNCAVQIQKLTYKFTLTDTYGDGWNNNVLYCSQNGFKKYFGAQFTSGHNFGPIQMEFDSLEQVKIGVHILGGWSYEIGFEVRDSLGALVFKLSSGYYLQPNAIIGDFCPGCLNLWPVKNVATAEGDEYSPSHPPQDKKEEKDNSKPRPPPYQDEKRNSKEEDKTPPTTPENERKEKKEKERDVQVNRVAEDSPNQQNTEGKASLTKEETTEKNIDSRPEATTIVFIMLTIFFAILFIAALCYISKLKNSIKGVQYHTSPSIGTASEFKRNDFVA